MLIYLKEKIITTRIKRVTDYLAVYKYESEEHDFLSVFKSSYMYLCECFFACSPCGWLSHLIKN